MRFPTAVVTCAGRKEAGRIATTPVTCEHLKSQENCILMVSFFCNFEVFSGKHSVGPGCNCEVLNNHNVQTCDNYNVLFNICRCFFFLFSNITVSLNVSNPKFSRVFVVNNTFSVSLQLMSPWTLSTMSCLCNKILHLWEDQVLVF